MPWTRVKYFVKISEGGALKPEVGQIMSFVAPSFGQNE